MTLSGKLRILALAIGAAAVLAAWAGVGAAYFLDAPRAVFVVAVVIAAFATEGMIWLSALVLGWTAFTKRHWLMGRIFKRPQPQVVG